MFRRDSLLSGIVQGLVFPALFFFVLIEVNKLLIRYWFEGGDGFSGSFIAIISIAANLIPITLANKNRNTMSMRGIMTSTLILTAVVVVYYWRQFNA